MLYHLVAIVAFILAASGRAFVSPLRTTSQIWRLKALPTPEESAKALSDYMAKSHEDKVRAIKDLEDKKNTEIKV